MTSSCPASPTSDGFVAAYEDLRGGVLTGSTAGKHFDLQLVIREGIAIWMTRSPSRAVPHVPPDEPAIRVASAPIVLDEIHARLVRGLASMALASRRHTHEC
jgi:hypothetical protein